MLKIFENAFFIYQNNEIHSIVKLILYANNDNLFK
jgi:hypothetical protein